MEFVSDNSNSSNNSDRVGIVAYQQMRDGLTHYVLPVGLRLLKANQQCMPIEFDPSRPSFFGICPLRNELTDEYIRSYEEEYGCIYEYVLTREIAVLASDDLHVLQFLHDSSVHNPKVQRVIEVNYGLHTGLRDSDASQDRIFAEYVNALGYEGYAASEMPTVSKGVFHAEIVLNNAHHGVQLVRQVTRLDRVDDIKQAAMLKRLSEISRDKRKQQKDFNRNNVIEIQQCLFGDDSDHNESDDDDDCSYPAFTRFRCNDEWASDHE